MSYDPIKTKLLFHENTTLRGVLEDVVANMQKLLHNYFSVQSIENPDDDVLVWNVDGVVTQIVGLLLVKFHLFTLGVPNDIARRHGHNAIY